MEKKKRNELLGKNQKLKNQHGRFPMVEDEKTGRKIKQYRYNELKMDVFKVPVSDTQVTTDDVYIPTGNKNSRGEYEYKYFETKERKQPEEKKDE